MSVTRVFFFVVLFSATSVLAQTPTTPPAEGEPGFRRGPNSQANLESMREISNSLTPVALTALPESDVVLDSATYGLSADGQSRGVYFEGSGQAGNTFFWFVDPATFRYRTIGLTGDNEADALRIDAYEATIDGPDPDRLSNIRALLAELQRQWLEFENGNKPNPRRIVGTVAEFEGEEQGVEFVLANSSPLKQSEWMCSGAGYASIITKDPPGFWLTETIAWAEWEWEWFAYDLYTGGSCEAEPEGGWLPPPPTTWYNESCDLEIRADFDGASTYTEGSYYNYDFQDDSLRTDVYQRARTWMYQGNARWSTTHVDSGEYSNLIRGVNGYNYAYCF